MSSVFRSKRPDGKEADAPYEPPPEMVCGKRSASEEAAWKADMKTRQREVEEKLYWSRHEPLPGGDAERAKLEKDWNDIRAAREQHEGKSWTYKHDRRDEFTLEQQQVKLANGEVRTNTTATGKVHNSETTICWRSDTEYGNKRYNDIAKRAKARGQIADGHDYGHLIADQYGVDPEGVNKGGITRATMNDDVRRLNYSSQHARSNEHGLWRKQESQVASAAKTETVDVKVSSQTSEKMGEYRELSRTMTATQERNGQQMELGSNKVVHGNFNDHTTTERRGQGKADSKIEQDKEKIRSRTDESKVVSLDEARSKSREGHVKK